jgi:signal transduction histidine kinase
MDSACKPRRDDETRGHPATLSPYQLCDIERWRTLGTLLPSMIHALTNPNGIIAFNADLLERLCPDIDLVLEEHAALNRDFRICGLAYDELKRELPALVAGIHEAAVRLQDIFSGIREQTKGLPATGDSLLDLNEVVRCTIRLVHRLIERRTERFSLTLADNLPRVMGSSVELGQVVLALVLNACQALPERTCSLQVRSAAASDPCFVQLEIEDEGVGLPSDWLDRLGRGPFVGPDGKVGLGLWVAFGIVEHHMGSLRLLPREKNGTLVQLTLPGIDGGRT